MNPHLASKYCTLFTCWLPPPLSEKSILHLSLAKVHLRSRNKVAAVISSRTVPVYLGRRAPREHQQPGCIDYCAPLAGAKNKPSQSTTGPHSIAEIRRYRYACVDAAAAVCRPTHGLRAEFKWRHTVYDLRRIHVSQSELTMLALTRARDPLQPSLVLR